MITRKNDLSSVDGEEISIANSFIMPSRIDGDKVIDGFTDRLNSQNTNRPMLDDITPTIHEGREDDMKPDFIDIRLSPSKNSKGVKTIKLQLPGVIDSRDGGRQVATPSDNILATMGTGSKQNRKLIQKRLREPPGSTMNVDSVCSVTSVKGERKASEIGTP